MKLIAKKLADNDKYDHLSFIRNDGSSSSAQMPRQHILPHDLLHYVVETAMGFESGFLGLIAKGADVQFVMQSAHDKTNPAVEMQAIQAEAMVEALQTQLWAGAFHTEDFVYGVETACAYRNTPAPDFQRPGMQHDLQASLFQRAQQLNEQWIQLAVSETLELEFNIAPAATSG